MLISELCNDYFWIMPKTPRYVDGATIPYITSKNLKNGAINYNDCKYITEDAFKNLTSKRFIQEDDFLISMIGTVGEVGVVKKSDLPIYGQNMYLLRPNYELVNKRYLYNFITSTYVNTKLQNIINGATQGYLHDKDIINLSLVDRSLDEQAKIATKLDSIRNIIELKQQEINNLDELIKSRFIEMFETIDLSEERLDWIELGDITKIYTGTTPSSKDESNWNGDILWITPAEMNLDSFYIYDTVRKITEKGRRSKSLDIMPINTVLLSTRAPIGKVGIIGKPMTCNQGFKNFECGSKLNPIFLYTLLKNNTEYLNSLGSGTTFLEVSKTKISKLKVPVPPIEGQIEFAEFSKQIDKLKFNVQKEIKDLQELLDKKMQEYFSE